MSKDPWIKWFPGDFLHGVSELEANEGWVYTIVLNLIYDHGGPWPLSVERLSRRCRLRPTSIEKALATLYDLGKLTLVDGCLTNGKAEKSIKSRQKVSENSAQAANVRWENSRTKVNENNDPDHASAMHQQCDRNAYQKLEARSQIEVSDAKASSVAGGDVQTAFDLWNELAQRIGLPLAKTLTTERRRHIKARLTGDGLTGWKEALFGVECSKHCRGENDRGWKADLDFVCRASSFQRLREGTYGRDAKLSPLALQDRPEWPGPAALRSAIVSECGEDLALGYLDRCAFRDLPTQAVIAPSAFIAKRLRQEAGRIFDAQHIEIKAKTEGAAA